MPIYEFTNNETNETFSLLLSFSERDEYLKTHPTISQNLSTPSFGDSTRLGVRRIDDSFNDVLKNVKSHHLHSTIETRN